MSLESVLEFQQSNETENGQFQMPQHTPYPSVWKLVKGSIDNMLSQAVQRAHTQLNFTTSGWNSFKEKVRSLLGTHLDHVIAGHPIGQGNHTIHKPVQEAISYALDGAMLDLNGTEMSANATLAFKDTFVRALDTEIELEVFNKIFTNVSAGLMDSTGKETDFFHKLPIKDETLFVVLVCMGIIVPIVFITLLFIFLYKKRQESQARRREMLLRDQVELSMDEYNKEGKSEDEEAVCDGGKNLSV